VVAALTTGVALISAVQPHGAREMPASIDLTGRSVIPSYTDRSGVHLLVPQTGRYRTTKLEVESVSPDLRYGIGIGEHAAPTYPVAPDRLGIVNGQSEDIQWIPMPFAVKKPVWAPDGSLIVAMAVDRDRGVDRAVLADPQTGAVRVINLTLSVSDTLTQLTWINPDLLLAVVVSQDMGTGTTVQRLVTLDVTGAYVRSVKISADWDVSGAVRNGRVPMTRLSERNLNTFVIPPEVALVDLTSGEIGTPVRMPWTGGIDVVAWRGDHTFLAEPLSQDGRPTYLLLLDLSTVSAVPMPFPIPDSSLSTVVMAPAEGLPAAVAKVAF
jgi:hypothetical protein